MIIVLSGWVGPPNGNLYGQKNLQSQHRGFLLLFLQKLRDPIFFPLHYIIFINPFRLESTKPASKLWP